MSLHEKHKRKISVFNFIGTNWRIFSKTQQLQGKTTEAGDAQSIKQPRRMD